MKIHIYRWPGRRGTRSEAFGWHHYHLWDGILLTWRWR